MCIAILNKLEQLSESTLKNSWNRNSDGAGILWSDGKKLFVHKEMNSVSKFIKKYNEIRMQTKFPIVLHFRIATSGKINEENCHPFMVCPNLGFVHNGMIDIDSNKLHSDTWHFNKLLQGMPKNFINNSAIREIISLFIGYSKLIFFNNLGEYTIINESFGHWDKSGNWYSNESYKDYSFSYAPKKSKKQSPIIDTLEDEIYSAYESGICTYCLNENADTFNSDFNEYLCTDCNNYIEKQFTY